MSSAMAPLTSDVAFERVFATADSKAVLTHLPNAFNFKLLNLRGWQHVRCRLTNG